MNELSTSRPIVVEAEAKKRFGEDAYTVGVLQNGWCYCGVFDGCGGLGGRRYPRLHAHTGAWIASKTAAYAVDRYLEENGFSLSEETAAKLQESIRSCLCTMKTECEPENSGMQIVSNLSCSMPTTVSMVFSKPAATGNAVDCMFLWAGDSRGFLLDRDGLCQISVDDIDTNADDAFLNLREDGQLTNIANADRSFDLHSRILKISAPVILLSATDGVFAYYATPMEFEYVLLRTLAQAKTPEEWQQLLHQDIKSVTGDDYTLTIACYGFADFNAMKQHYAARLQQVYQSYIRDTQKLSEKELLQLWSKYKQSYYRWNEVQ